MTLTMYRMEDTERVRFKLREDRRREVSCRGRLNCAIFWQQKHRLERGLRKKRSLRRQKMRDWRGTEGGGRRGLAARSCQLKRMENWVNGSWGNWKIRNGESEEKTGAPVDSLLILTPWRKRIPDCRDWSISSWGSCSAPSVRTRWGRQPRSISAVRDTTSVTPADTDRTWR